MHVRWHLSLAILLTLASGCTRPIEAPAHKVESYVSSPGSVGFDITQTKRKDGSISVQATYAAQGKLAKFGIEFGPSRKLEGDNAKDFVAWTGKGEFVAQAGSDATVLLADLQKALEAKAIPSKAQRTRTLPFVFVNIGDNLSQTQEGGFNVDPPGGWTAIKIFIGEGEQEGQVFVNLDPTMGKGQFSIKDPDYGNIVLRQLAGVL